MPGSGPSSYDLSPTFWESPVALGPSAPLSLLRRLCRESQPGTITAKPASAHLMTLCIIDTIGGLEVLESGDLEVLEFIFFVFFCEGRVRWVASGAA